METSDYLWARAQQVQWLTITMAETLNTLAAKGLISRDQVARARDRLDAHRQGCVPDAATFFDAVASVLENPHRQL